MGYFVRVSIELIATLVEVWENSKQQWKQFPQQFLVLPNFYSCFYLTYRLHVAVRLYSNDAHTMSKRDKSKEV